MFKDWIPNHKSLFACIPGKNGFLPKIKPLKKLPRQYDTINSILDTMKISSPNSLITEKKIKQTIENDLPIYNFEGEISNQIIGALFRDYCFMASAYSLEPSHNDLKDGKYGKARTELPKNLAIPLLLLSEKLDVFPWLDYAYGYGLNNAVLKSPDHEPGKYDSYETCRMFNGSPSESGFINVHVAMVSYTGELLDIQQKILKSASDENYNDLAHFLNRHYSVMNKIIETLQTMWKASNKSDYLSFRTFIMGQKGNQEMYPDETIRFDLGDNTYKDFSFRGETGAQDSIIPCVDNLFQVTYPENNLTEYLYQLREYRPKDHQDYIEYNLKMSKTVGLIEKIFLDPNCSLAYYKNLNLIRIFRKKHWNLTKRYIIKNTDHPVATGGTPITTWLPNQLGATMEKMFLAQNQIEKMKNRLSDSDRETYTTIKLALDEHSDSLFDEVHNLQPSFSKQEYGESCLKNN